MPHGSSNCINQRSVTFLPSPLPPPGLQGMSDGTKARVLPLLNDLLLLADASADARSAGSQGGSGTGRRLRVHRQCTFTVPL